MSLEDSDGEKDQTEMVVETTIACACTWYKYKMYQYLSTCYGVFYDRELNSLETVSSQNSLNAVHVHFPSKLV